MIFSPSIFFFFCKRRGGNKVGIEDLGKADAFWAGWKETYSSLFSKELFATTLKFFFQLLLEMTLRVFFQLLKISFEVGYYNVWFHLEDPFVRVLEKRTIKRIQKSCILNWTCKTICKCNIDHYGIFWYDIAKDTGELQFCLIRISKKTVLSETCLSIHCYRLM